MLTQVTNHEEQSIDLLLEQFKGKLAIEDLVSSFSFLFNQIEQDLFNMLTRRISIPLSEGEQLTLLGKLVNTPRAGRSDADLRTAIAVSIDLFSATGTRDNIIEICDSLIQITEYLTPPSGEFDAIAPTATTTVIGEELNRRINRSRSAGIYYTFQWTDSTIGPSNRFVFDTVGSTFDGTDLFAVHTRSSSSY